MTKFLKLMMLLALLSVPWVSQAQAHYNLQVGSGTDQYQYVPNYTYYNYSYSQMLYTANEIGINGVIDTLAFQVASGGSTRSLTIYMAEVDQTALASQVSAADLTEVFHGSVTWAQGWVYIPLNTTFDYQDTGSLVIAVLDSTGTWASGYPYFAGTTMTNNRSMYNYQDGSPYDASSPLSSTSDFLPNIILGLTSDAAYCATPGNVAVTNIDFDSAHISWVENGGATAWDLIVSDTLVTDFENANILSVSATDYTITGLNGNTPYYVYVRANCGSNSVSGWTSATYFRSACMGYTAVPYVTGFEDVESDLPNCWIAVASGSSSAGTFPSAYNYSTNARNGNIYFEFESNGGHTEIAALPQMEDINTLQLEFYASLMNANFTLEAGVIEDDSVFVPVDTLDLVVGSGNNWHNSYNLYTVYFDQYSGSGDRIAMRVTGTGSYTLMIDDLAVSEIPSCLPPANFRIDSIGTTYVGLSWNDENGSGWEVLYGPEGFNPLNTSISPVSATETNIVLTGLTAGTAYAAYVRGDCGGDYSPWFGPLTFVPGQYNMRFSGTDTLRACGLTIYDDGGANSAYNTGTVSSLVLYPSSEDSLIAFSGTTDIYSYYANLRIFNGVGATGSILWQSTSDYETIPATTSFAGPITIVWNAGSYNYGSTGFEINTHCVAAPQCASVQNIQVPAVSTSSAYVTWTVSGLNLGVPSSYEVECYDTTNTMVANVVSTTTNTMFTGLTPGNTYKVKVRTVCDGDEYGAFDSVTFSTQNLACVEFDPASSHNDTIGNGTSTSSTIPTNTCYNYSLTQQIYKASELSGAGNLTSISVMPQSLASNGASRNWEIYLGHVADSTASSYLTPADLTMVYSGTVSFTANQWAQILFDNSFNYNGTDNLLVVVRDMTGSYSCSNYWYTHTAASGASRYVYQDGSSYPVGFNGGSSSSNRMNAIFGFTTCTQLASCAAPVVVVDSVATDYIGISWAAGYQETSWVVEHRADTTNVWTVDGTTSSDSWTYTNLSPNMRYHFRVGAVCSDTTMYTTVSALTKCGAEPLPFITGFENYPSSGYPSCWYAATTYSYGSYPSPSTSYVHSGAQALDMYSGSGSYTYLVLPEFDAPIDTLEVSFWMYSTYSGYPNELYVGVMSDPENFNTFQAVGVVANSAISTWEAVKVSFSNYQGNASRIAIVSPQSTEVYSYIDDLSVNMVSPCNGVENVNLVYSTTDSAVIAWNTTGNTYFDVVYGPANFILDSGTFITTTIDTVVIGGLTPNTQYDVYVRTICGDGDTSNWSNAFTFRTQCVEIAAVPYTESFENNAPGWSQGSNTNFYPCWYRYNTPDDSYYYPYVDGYNAHTGTNALYWYFDTYNGYEPYITLPAFDTNAVDLSLMQLSFWAMNNSSYADVPMFVVGTMSNPEAINTFQPLDTVTISSMNFTLFEVPLSNYTGGYIAIKAYNTGDYFYAYMDDVTIDSLPSCLHVYDLATTGNTATSVTIGWTEQGGSTTWEVAIDTDPTATPVADTTVYTTPGVTINGLTTGTTYYIWVRSVCSSTDASAWEGPIMAIPGTWTMRPNMTDTLTMCGGVIYDDGGATGAYSTNQDSYIIIYPETPNALVAVSGTSYTEGIYDHLHIYDGEGTGGVELWNDYGVSSTQTFGPFISSNGPITLYFKSDVSVTYDGFEVNVSCYIDNCPVSDLMQDTNVALSSSSLAVTWTGSSSSYDIAYGPKGSEIDSCTTISTTTNSAVIGGLNPTTAYDIYVRGLCNNGDTGMWHKITLSTELCDNATAFFTGAGTGTSYYTPLNDYYNYTLTETIIDSAELSNAGFAAGSVIQYIAYSFAYSSPMSSKTDVNIWLQPTNKTTFSSSSDIDTIDATNAVLVYSGALNCVQGWNFLQLQDTIPFTWDGQSNLMVIVDDNSGDYDGSSYVFDNTNCTGYKTIQWYDDYDDPDVTSEATASAYTGSANYYQYRSTMKLVSCGASCPKPAGLTATNVTYNSATLNWSSNATDFEVSWKATTEATWSAPVAVTGATSYTVTGLVPETAYQFMVHAICDANEGLISDWTIGTFTTADLPCFVPTDLQADPSYTDATISWTAVGQETQWTLHVWNSTFDQEYTVSAKPYTVTGLTQSVAYNAAVKAVCGDGAAESEYSDTISFTTVTCAVVTGVTATATSGTTATVSWTPTGASVYEVNYGNRGFQQGGGRTITVNDATTCTITDLEPASNYDIYVRALCETGVYGGWSSVAQITTPDQEGISTADGMNISIYPNPTTSSTTVALSGVAGEVAITIVDMNGRVVMSDSMSCEGDCTKTLEVTGLAQGAYFVRISGENVNMVKKLVVK